VLKSACSSVGPFSIPGEPKARSRTQVGLGRKATANNTSRPRDRLQSFEGSNKPQSVGARLVMPAPLRVAVLRIL